jgi:hypothetical protein
MKECLRSKIVENELPESFKVAIPKDHFRFILDKLNFLGFDIHNYYTLLSFANFFIINKRCVSHCISINVFMDCSEPEITLTQLMSAKPKVNEIDEGLKNLSDCLERCIETLKRLQGDIYSKRNESE